MRHPKYKTVMSMLFLFSNFVQMIRRLKTAFFKPVIKIAGIYTIHSICPYLYEKNSFKFLFVVVVLNSLGIALKC